MEIFQSISFAASLASVASYFPSETAVVGTGISFIFIATLFGLLSSIYMNYSFSKHISSSRGYYEFSKQSLGKRYSASAGWFALISYSLGFSSFPALFFSGGVWPLIPGLSSLSYGWIPLALLPYAFVFVIYILWT
ncbi:MAG: hypothetical protein QW752_03530 [Thermoplasmata archaeon]